MAYYYLEKNLITEPSVSHLARACLNIQAQIFSEYEDCTMGNYLKKRHDAALGTTQ